MNNKQDASVNPAQKYTSPNEMRAGENMAAQGVSPQVNNTQGGKSNQKQESLSTLNNAPQAMKENQPSNFAPNQQENKKKSKKGLLFACCCSCLVLIVLIIVGLFVYEYATDAGLPGFSDAVDKVKEVIEDPQSEAKQMQQEMSDTLVGMVIPVMAEDNGITSSFVKTNLSEEDINKFMSDAEQIDSLRYSIKVESDTDMGVAVEDGVSSNLKTDAEISGAYNFKDKENKAFEISVNSSSKGGGMSFPISLESKTIGDRSFTKFNSMALLGMQTDDDFGGWVLVEEDDLMSDSGLGLFSILEDNQQEIDEEDISNLQELMTDNSIIRNVEMLPDETIEGNESKCLKLRWNNEELLEVMKKYNEIYEKDQNDEDLKKSLEYVNFVEIEGCMGKETSKIHRVKLTIDIKYSDSSVAKGASGNTVLELKLWDYNADISIEEPQDYITMEEFLKKMNEDKGELDFGFGEEN